MFILISTVIIVTGLASCAMSILSVSPFRYRQGPIMSGFLLLWLGLTLFCDCLITITLFTQLWLKRNKEFRFVNRVLHRAIRLTIETGGLTCGVAIVELVLMATSNTNSYYALIIFSGKIYSNSLLVSLNSRAPIFRKDEPADEEVWQVEEGNIAFRRTGTLRSTQTGVRSDV